MTIFPFPLKAKVHVYCVLEIGEMCSEKTNPVGSRGREHFEPAERFHWVHTCPGCKPYRSPVCVIPVKLHLQNNLLVIKI